MSSLRARGSIAVQIEWKDSQVRAVLAGGRAQEIRMGIRGVYQ